jgi:hypothetical protein
MIGDRLVHLAFISNPTALAPGHENGKVIVESQ